MTWAGFGVIFMYSLIASLHCGAMCSPLVCAYLLQSRGRWSFGIALYNFGRGSAYVAGGAALGALGQTLTTYSGILGQVLSGLLGLSLMVWGALTWFGVKTAWPKSLAAPNLGLLRAASRRLQRLPSAVAMFGLGVLTLFLPCMTLTPMLGLAAASGASAVGAAIATAFWFGTLPMMVLGPALQRRVVAFGPRRWTAKVTAIFTFAAGILTVYRIFH